MEKILQTLQFQNDMDSIVILRIFYLDCFVVNT